MAFALFSFVDPNPIDPEISRATITIKVTIEIGVLSILKRVIDHEIVSIFP
jgi:hypothetical protein